MRYCCAWLHWTTHARTHTLGRSPLDEGSAQRRDLYLTTHNTHNRQTSIPSSGIQTHNANKRKAADLRIRARGHRDRQKRNFRSESDVILLTRHCQDAWFWSVMKKNRRNSQNLEKCVYMRSSLKNWHQNSRSQVSRDYINMPVASSALNIACFRATFAAHQQSFSTGGWRNSIITINLKVTKDISLSLSVL